MYSYSCRYIFSKEEHRHLRHMKTLSPLLRKADLEEAIQQGKMLNAGYTPVAAFGRCTREVAPYCQCSERVQTSIPALLEVFSFILICYVAFSSSYCSSFFCSSVMKFRTLAGLFSLLYY